MQMNSTTRKANSGHVVKGCSASDDTRTSGRALRDRESKGGSEIYGGTASPLRNFPPTPTSGWIFDINLVLNHFSFRLVRCEKLKSQLVD